MGFLDKISKTVTDAGQKTAQKTKEIADISRINSLISQDENKINNLYYQIGKLYMSIHGNDGENEFQGLIESVAELEQQVRGYREQIQEIKGVQTCEMCGAKVEKGAAFCSSCGSPMPKAEKQINNDDFVMCSNCGNSVLKGMRFCTSCGHPMSIPTPTQSMDEAQNIPEESAGIETTTEFEATESVNTVNVCPNCGEKLVDDAMFCPECGTKL